jgi:hypothetical protein
MAASDRDTLMTGDQLEPWVYERLRSNLPTATYDERAWQDYLTTSGTQWDGTDAAWPAFREWFAFYAQERGFGTPADTLLSQLDSKTSADRISTLGGYGVMIRQAPRPAQVDDGFGWVAAEQRTVLASRFGADWTGPLTADLSARWGAAWQQNPPEHKAAWLAQLVAGGAYAAPGEAGAVADDAYLALLAAAIRQVPGYDRLSQDQLATAIDAGLT